PRVSRLGAQETPLRMPNTLVSNRILLGFQSTFVSMFLIACSSGGSANPTPGTAGTTGGAGTGSGGTTGSAGSTGGNPVVLTPEGTLLMDDFESGAGKWMVSQGTCSILMDGSNVFNCINGGNEARALGGQIGWGEYSVQARVKVNAMDAGRRI